MRTTYRYDRDLECLIEVGGNSNFFEEKPQGPAVRSDRLPGGVDGLHNPATAKSYDSKSRYYADTKAAGCEILGNEPARRNRQRESSDKALAGRARDIKESIEKIRGDHPETMMQLTRERETYARLDYQRRNS